MGYASGVRLLDCSKLAIIWENDNDVTIYWHDVIVNFFWRDFLSLVNFSYWSKFYVNIIPGSGVMTIFFYKGLTRSLSFSQYLETGRVRGTKFDTNFSNECYWILQNARVTAFTVSELIKGKQQGVAKITAPPPPHTHTHTQIRVSVFLFIYSMQWEIKIQTENIYDQKKTKTSSKEYVT